MNEETALWVLVEGSAPGSAATGDTAAMAGASARDIPTIPDPRCGAAGDAWREILRESAD